MREFADYDIDYIERHCIESSSISVAGTAVGKNLTNIEGLATEDSSINEGTVFYDILFKVHFPDDKGKIVSMYINIEAQKSYYTEYSIEKRAMFYASRKLSSQIKKVNAGSRYNALEKVYSIWLCIGDVPDKDAGQVYACRMVRDNIIGINTNDTKDYDLIELIFVKINDKVELEDNTLKLLQALSSDIFTKEEKLEKLEALGIKVEEDIEKGVATMCNLSDLIVEKGLRKGIEQGIAQGIEQGIAQGNIQGAKSMQKSIALNLIALGYAQDEITKILNVDKQELIKLLKN